MKTTAASQIRNHQRSLAIVQDEIKVVNQHVHLLAGKVRTTAEGTTAQAYWSDQADRAIAHRDELADTIDDLEASIARLQARS
jgi:hypothetical protein